MEIKKIAINRLLNNCSQFSHGADYLTINLKTIFPKLNKILNKLDSDNSNFEIEKIDDYYVSYVKGNSKNGLYLAISISINNIPYKIFDYLEYSESKINLFKSKGSFIFYGTYFRLIERGNIDLSFESAFFGDFYDEFKLLPISRLDYRLDFLFKDNYLCPKAQFIVDCRKDTKKSLYGKLSNDHTIHLKGNNLTGWSLGSKKNKSVYLRVYDKLLDSIEKGKTVLYDDYFTFNKVYRIEGEFRTKFNKKPLSNGLYRSYYYRELDELIEKCKNYFCLSGDKLKKYIYQYKENKNINEIDARYLNDFGGRAINLALKKHNPFIVIVSQFIKKEFIKEQVSKDLLENLILEFDNHKQKLISQKFLFCSQKKSYGDNKGKNQRGTIENTI